MGAPDQAFTWPHRIYEWNSLNEPRLLGCHILLLLLPGWYDYNLGSPRMIVDDWNGGVQPAVLTWQGEGEREWWGFCSSCLSIHNSVIALWTLKTDNNNSESKLNELCAGLRTATVLEWGHRRASLISTPRGPSRGDTRWWWSLFAHWHRAGVIKYEWMELDGRHNILHGWAEWNFKGTNEPTKITE